jgi:hypothetical protein
MTEQSGCDPRAAMEARLRRVMVDNDVPVTDWFVHGPTNPIDLAPPGTLIEKDLSSYFASHRDPGDETDYDMARIKGTWMRMQAMGGRQKTVILTEPMTYTPFAPDYPPTPGEPYDDPLEDGEGER